MKNKGEIFLGEIHVGSINPLKRRAKNIYDAVAMSIAGDTIVLHKSFTLTAQQGIEVLHTLYFTAAEKNITIGIPPGTVGFFVQGKASLEFSNIQLLTAGQANAICLSEFQGTLRFQKSAIKYQSGIQFRDRNPLLLSDSSYSGTLECIESILHQLEVALSSISIKGSQIGFLPIMGGKICPSLLYAQQLTIESSMLTHLEVASGQPEEFQDISSFGNLEFIGTFNINTLTFKALSFTEKEVKAKKRMIKKYGQEQTSIIENFSLKMTRALSKITIHNLTALPSTLPVELSQSAFMLYQSDSQLEIHHGKINLYPFKTLIDGEGAIIYEDVVDDTQYTIGKKPHISGERSISALLETIEIQKKEQKDNSKALEELQGMIGLKEPKEKVHRIAATERMKSVQISRGMAAPLRGNRNLIFAGPPGTGKTTVADKMAQILFDIGAIKRNVVYETTPGKLKGTVIGESGKNLIEACEKAKGGVLFIDEAYSLTTDDQYNKDIIDELLTWTDEKHCEDLIVILAGYKKEIEELIYKTNPGLARRFPTWVNFEDYSSEELQAIALYVLKKRQALISENAFDLLFKVLDEKVTIAKTLPHFGNASYINTFVNKLLEARDVRLSQFTHLEDLSNEQLMTVTVSDINEVAQSFQ